MKSQNEDTLLKEFENMPKQHLSDSAKQRMLSAMENQKGQFRTRTRFPRWVGSMGASVAAVIVVGAGIFGVVHHNQSAVVKRPTTAVNQTAKSISQQKSEANNETTTKIGRTMHIGYYDVKVNSVKKASSIGGNDTSQGVYYILNVTLENTSRPEIILRTNMFSVVDKHGNKYNLDQTATMDEDIAGVYMFSDQLVQGQSRTSNLVFDLPKPQNHLALEVSSDSGSVLNIPFN